MAVHYFPSFEVGHSWVDGNAPLNGPAWSLYYEYIGNILYALFVRKFNKVALSILVFLAACATLHLCLTAPNGDIVGGWALNWEQQYVGFVRLLYPFFAGLLLSRLGWLIRVKKRAFWWCSLMIVIVLSVPRIGGEDGFWMNGLMRHFALSLSSRSLFRWEPVAKLRENAL